MEVVWDTSVEVIIDDVCLGVDICALGTWTGNPKTTTVRTADIQAVFVKGENITFLIDDDILNTIKKEAMNVLKTETPDEVIYDD